MKYRFIITLIVVLGCVRSFAEVSPTNSPFAGVRIFSESRTNPPNRLYAAVIDLTNPRVRLSVSRGGPDPDGDGPWQTTLMQPTQIAQREGFDLVVNGDFFHAQGVKDAEGTNSTYCPEVWSTVTGPSASDGKVWAIATNARPSLLIYADRSVEIRTISRPGTNVLSAIAGNTMLVKDGVVLALDNKVRHPRTVVGLDKDRKRLVLLVVDGRKPGIARGMSYHELAQEMLRLGCYNALNLDGGGSSVMALRDKTSGKMTILNAPTDGRERAVANVLGVTVDVER